MYGQNYKVVELQGVATTIDVVPTGGVVPTGVEQQGLRTVTGVQTGLVGGCQTVGVQGGLWEQPEIVAELVKLPRVLPVYAKTRQNLEEIMQHVEQNPSDLSVHCLLNAHSTSYTPKVFPYRGFTLVNGEQRLRQIEQVEELEQRPVWFLFSGMGGVEQWQCGQLREMMKLDAFRCSILKSCEVLRPYGVNLLQLINTPVEQQQQPIMTGVESFVYLTAVQIALVDCLRQIGVKPEGLIGQSVGELVCAYVDQCLTHEQALMTSYYLARCVQQAKTLPKSIMAVVGGCSWEQLRSRCPTGVVPVCFESQDQFMITGPVQQVREFLRQLTQLEGGVYVREIELPTTCENFGLLHSQHLNEIVPVMRQYLECLNIVPKQRSSRWLSTSLPEQQWTTSPMNVEYLLNLFTSPVMLQQTLRQVPTNAVVIEISPRSLMSTLLRRSFVQQQQQQQTVVGGLYTTGIRVAGGCGFVPTIVSLMPSTFGVQGPKPLEHFMIQLGRLFVLGVDFDSVKLFVPIHLERTVYPVPVEQKVLDLLSQWSIKPEPLSYFVQQQQQQQQQMRCVEDSVLNGLNSLTISSTVGCGDVETYKFTVDVESLLEKESYLLNHQVNGRVLYPTTGYLYLVWKSLAQLQQQQKSTVGVVGQPILLDSIFGQSCEFKQLPPVCFENVLIHRATVLREQPQQVVVVPENRRVLFQINIQPSTGLFEIVEGRNVIVNGRVYVPTGLEMNEFVTPFKSQWESSVRCNLVMPQEEIYRQFKQCGYEYNGEFQPIVRSNVLGTQGELLWTGKWIPFLDAMLQINILAQKLKSGEQTTNGVFLPTRIRSVKINPVEHLIRADTFVTLPIVHDMYTNKTQCGSIEITGLQTTPVVLPRGQYSYYPTTSVVCQQQVTGGLNCGGIVSPSTSTVTLTVPVVNGARCFGGVEGVEQWFSGCVGQEWTVKVGQQQQQQQLTVEGQQGQFTVESTTPYTVGGKSFGEQVPVLGQKLIVGGEQPVFGGLFNPTLTHVIVGGLDCEFGLELAQWMVQCGGARYLVLTTSRVVYGGEPSMTVQQVQKLRCLQNEFGCQIKIVSNLDLNDETECLLLVKQACRMTSHFEGRIGSVFHLGGLFGGEQSSTTGQLPLRSLYHLDKHTRCSTVMPDYGFFVALTRSFNVTGGLTGLQSIVESVCESRRRECGKHGLVVEWTVLFNQGVEGQFLPTGIQYQQAFVRLAQLLIRSVRVQLPVEFQQIFGEQFPVVQSVEQRVQGGLPFVLPSRVVERLNNVEYVYGQQQPLFVVLPIGSQVGLIKSWAQQVKVPVYGLYITPECLKYETVEQLGQFFWQQIERVFPQLEKFHLVGHTYGVPVAFEMALRRPTQVVSLVLLDSGLTQSFLNNNTTGFYGFGVGSVEIEALYKFYQQFVLPSSRIAYEQFVQVLSQFVSFDERVKYVVGKIVEQSQQQFVDTFELEQACRLFVRQLIMSFKYVPTQPLRLNNILVVRPTTTTLTTGVPQYESFVYGQQQQQSELFEQELVEKIFQGLRQFVSGKLQVHLVDVEPKSFFQCERIASILNQHLNRQF